MVERHTINPTYCKENGLWLLNIDQDSLPGVEEFEVVERNVVYIPSGQFGGNHRHPRTEAFVGVGDKLTLIWQDENGENHSEPMINQGCLELFVVRSMVPHVVVNEAESPAILIELANDTQHKVESVDLLKQVS